MKFLIEAFNNTDWMGDTNYVLLELSDKDIKTIHEIQDVFNKYLPDTTCVGKLYNMSFTVHSEDTIREFPQLDELIESQVDPMIIPEGFDIKDIPDSESINDIRLEGYIVSIRKGSIQCICYGKYDGSIEVFTDDIEV